VSTTRRPCGRATSIHTLIRTPHGHSHTPLSRRREFLRFFQLLSEDSSFNILILHPSSTAHPIRGRGVVYLYNVWSRYTRRRRRPQQQQQQQQQRLQIDRRTVAPEPFRTRFRTIDPRGVWPLRPSVSRTNRNRGPQGSACLPYSTLPEVRYLPSAILCHSLVSEIRLILGNECRCKPNLT